MSDHPKFENRNRERRVRPRRSEHHFDFLHAEPNSDDSPGSEKIRDAWRQILDRRLEDRRQRERRKNWKGPANLSAAPALER